jgi:hypothetical protein
VWRMVCWSVVWSSGESSAATPMCAKPHTTPAATISLDRDDVGARSGLGGAAREDSRFAVGTAGLEPTQLKIVEKIYNSSLRYDSSMLSDKRHAPPTTPTHPEASRLSSTLETSRRRGCVEASRLPSRRP